MAKDEKEPRGKVGLPSGGYEPPAIVESAKFETLVAACGYLPNQRAVPACRIDNSRGGGGN